MPLELNVHYNKLNLIDRRFITLPNKHLTKTNNSFAVGFHSQHEILLLCFFFF